MTKIFSPLLWTIIFLLRFNVLDQETQPHMLRTASTNLVAILTLSEQTRSQLTFGLDKVPSLQIKVLGVELWQYVASLIYIFLAFAVARLLDYLIAVQLKKWTEKTKTQLDDILI